MERSKVFRLLAVAILTSLAIGPSNFAAENRRSSEGCGWISGQWSGDFDREIDTLATFDDGTGPALYASGRFSHINGRRAAGVARWDVGGWTTLEGVDGFWSGGVVFSMMIFDDGSGEALYAAGGVLDEKDVGYPAVARWNGVGWTELGALSHHQGWAFVSAIVEYDDGSGPALYAGGAFDFADGLQVDNIAKWNGSTWEPLTGPMGTGTDGQIKALAVFDDGTGSGLYVGGWYTNAGGREVNAIARWDGSDWEGLPGPSGVGTDNWVGTLEVWDDGTGLALFVGGTFNETGGIYTSRVAKWDGSAWSELSGPSGTGISGGDYEVRDLIVFDDGSGQELYAAGGFTLAGGIETSNIASWDGTAWSVVEGPMAEGTSEIVNALAVINVGDGPVLIAGGDFDLAGGIRVGKIAAWDGQSWSALSDRTGNGVGSTISALSSFDGGGGLEMIAAGSFQSAGNTAAGLIAAWDGAGWRALEGPAGNGIEGGDVKALQVWDRGSGPELYVAGYFRSAGGLEARHIARWTGSAWSALAGSSGFWNTGIRTLGVFDDGHGEAMYAAGSFTEISDIEANRIAKWNGVGWSPLIGPHGNGVGQYSVNDLEIFDAGSGPALFVGGYFEEAGGIRANRIAKWDGQNWSALVGPGGNGVSEYWVRALAVFDDGGGPDLYVGGTFETAGGVVVNNLARWDGSNWSTVDGPAGFGVKGGGVTSLEVFDDGSGPVLVVGGYFDSAGGIDANNIARWDGAEWSPIEGPAGNGTDETVWAISSLHDGVGPALFVGGYLTSAGGLASDRMAIWRCPDNLLFADGFELGTTSGWSQTVP